MSSQVRSSDAERLSSVVCLIGEIHQVTRGKSIIDSSDDQSSVVQSNMQQHILEGIPRDFDQSCLGEDCFEWRKFRIALFVRRQSGDLNFSSRFPVKIYFSPQNFDVYVRAPKVEELLSICALETCLRVNRGFGMIKVGRLL